MARLWKESIPVAHFQRLCSIVGQKNGATCGADGASWPALGAQRTRRGAEWPRGGVQPLSDGAVPQGLMVPHLRSRRRKRSGPSRSGPSYSGPSCFVGFGGSAAPGDQSIERIPAGAHKNQPECNQHILEGVGWGSLSGCNVARPRHEHRDRKQKGHRDGEYAEQDEERTDGLGKGGHESPERWPEGDAESLHRAPEPFPALHATHQLPPSMIVDKADSKACSNDEKADVARL